MLLSKTSRKLFKLCIIMLSLSLMCVEACTSVILRQKVFFFVRRSRTSEALTQQLDNYLFRTEWSVFCARESFSRRPSIDQSSPRAREPFRIPSRAHIVRARSLLRRFRCASNDRSASDYTLLSRTCITGVNERLHYEAKARCIYMRDI